MDNCPNCTSLAQFYSSQKKYQEELSKRYRALDFNANDITLSYRERCEAVFEKLQIEKEMENL